MSHKNKFFTLLILSTGAVAVTGMINKYIKMKATSKNILAEPQPNCYKWRFGDIFYTKSGSGKPLLLIHNLNAWSSSFEWRQLKSKLEEQYTIYAVDLLGCGKSEKPNLTYTNYFYVQLISDFIKSEIGHRTNIIATGGSSSLAIMACNYNPDLFDKMMLINPDSLHSCNQIPGKNAKVYKFIMGLSILGTLMYHIASSKQFLMKQFQTNYFYNPYNVKSAYIDAYCESAHLGQNPRSMFASEKCNYTKCNIINALKKIDNSIYLVGGSGISDIQNIFDEYKQQNPAIESSIIAETKMLPQLEKPAELSSIIKMYFS